MSSAPPLEQRVIELEAALVRAREDLDELVELAPHNDCCRLVEFKEMMDARDRSQGRIDLALRAGALMKRDGDDKVSALKTLGRAVLQNIPLVAKGLRWALENDDHAGQCRLHEPCPGHAAAAALRSLYVITWNCMISGAVSTSNQDRVMMLEWKEVADE